MRSTPHASNPHRQELLAIYQATDALFAGMSCDASTDCCRFGVTGREPYPTAIEIAELQRAIAASGRKITSAKEKTKKKRLNVLGVNANDVEHERRCPLLSDAGRCVVYASRPFGCRTFFCDRAEGEAPRREEVTELSRKIAALSDRFYPENPGPRPLSRVKL